MTIKATPYKGGAGSGNFGHAGRPGKVGGSAPDDVTSAEEVSPKPKGERDKRKPVDPRVLESDVMADQDHGGFGYGVFVAEKLDKAGYSTIQEAREVLHGWERFRERTGYYGAQIHAGLLKHYIEKEPDRAVEILKESDALYVTLAGSSDVARYRAAAARMYIENFAKGETFTELNTDILNTVSDGVMRGRNEDASILDIVFDQTDAILGREIALRGKLTGDALFTYGRQGLFRPVAPDSELYQQVKAGTVDLLKHEMFAGMSSSEKGGKFREILGFTDGNELLQNQWGKNATIAMAAVATHPELFTYSDLLKMKATRWSGMYQATAADPEVFEGVADILLRSVDAMSSTALAGSEIGNFWSLGGMTSGWQNALRSAIGRRQDDMSLKNALFWMDKAPTAAQSVAVARRAAEEGVSFDEVRSALMSKNTFLHPRGMEEAGRLGVSGIRPIDHLRSAMLTIARNQGSFRDIEHESPLVASELREAGMKDFISVCRDFQINPRDSKGLMEFTAKFAKNDGRLRDPQYFTDVVMSTLFALADAKSIGLPNGFYDLMPVKDMTQADVLSVMSKAKKSVSLRMLTAAQPSKLSWGDIESFVSNPATDFLDSDITAYWLIGQVGAENVPLRNIVKDEMKRFLRPVDTDSSDAIAELEQVIPPPDEDVYGEDTPLYREAYKVAKRVAPALRQRGINLMTKSVDPATGAYVPATADKAFYENFTAGHNLASIAGEQKDTIVKGLAPLLENESGDLDSAYEEVNEFIHQWALTSNEHDRSLLTQSVAAETFGCDLSDWQADMMMDVREEDNSSMWLDYAKPERRRELSAALLRKMHADTQAYLSAHGVSHITLYRGTDPENVDGEIGDVVRYQDNALSSWSTNYNVARGFGSTVLSITVPAAKVLSTCRTGFGCLSEEEFVVIGERGVGHARIVNSMNAAPGIDELPTKALAVKGGPGSGHFDHEGRPGEVGGSAKEDGVQHASTVERDAASIRDAERALLSQHYQGKKFKPVGRATHYRGMTGAAIAKIRVQDSRGSRFIHLDIESGEVWESPVRGKDKDQLKPLGKYSGDAVSNAVSNAAIVSEMTGEQPPQSQGLVQASLSLFGHTEADLDRASKQAKAIPTTLLSAWVRKQAASGVPTDKLRSSVLDSLRAVAEKSTKPFSTEQATDLLDALDHAGINFRESKVSDAVANNFCWAAAAITGTGKKYYVDDDIFILEKPTLDALYKLGPDVTGRLLQMTGDSWMHDVWERKHRYSEPELAQKPVYAVTHLAQHFMKNAVTDSASIGDALAYAQRAGLSHPDIAHDIVPSLLKKFGGQLDSEAMVGIAGMCRPPKTAYDLDDTHKAIIKGFGRVAVKDGTLFGDTLSSLASALRTDTSINLAQELVRQTVGAMGKKGASGLKMNGSDYWHFVIAAPDYVGDFHPVTKPTLAGLNQAWNGMASIGGAPQSLAEAISSLDEMRDVQIGDVRDLSTAHPQIDPMVLVNGAIAAVSRRGDVPNLGVYADYFSEVRRRFPDLEYDFYDVPADALSAMIRQASWSDVGKMAMHGVPSSLGEINGLFEVLDSKIATEGAPDSLQATGWAAEMLATYYGGNKRLTVPPSHEAIIAQREIYDRFALGIGEESIDIATGSPTVVSEGQLKVAQFFRNENQREAEGGSREWAEDVAQGWKDAVANGLVNAGAGGYDDMEDFVHTWAESSNEGEDSIAIQKVAGDMFGAPLSSWQREIWDDLGVKLSKSEARRTQKTLKAMYDVTQKWFKEQGVTHLRLFRGVSADLPEGIAHGDVVPIEDNALASWSLSPVTAQRFSSEQRSSPDQVSYIMEAVIPVDRILSTPFTGFGCLAEQECVVIGSAENAFAKMHIDYMPEAASNFFKAWNEGDHPRHEAGTSEGGQFAPKDGSGTSTPIDDEEKAMWGSYPSLAGVYDYYAERGNGQPVDAIVKDTEALRASVAQALGTLKTKDVYQAVDLLRLVFPAYGNLPKVVRDDIAEWAGLRLSLHMPGSEFRQFSQLFNNNELSAMLAEHIKGDAYYGDIDAGTITYDVNHAMLYWDDPALNREVIDNAILQRSFGGSPTPLGLAKSGMSAENIPQQLYDQVIDDWLRKNRGDATAADMADLLFSEVPASPLNQRNESDRQLTSSGLMVANRLHATLMTKLIDEMSYGDVLSLPWTDYMTSYLNADSPQFATWAGLFARGIENSKMPPKVATKLWDDMYDLNGERRDVAKQIAFNQFTDPAYVLVFAPKTWGGAISNEGKEEFYAAALDANWSPKQVRDLFNAIDGRFDIDDMADALAYGMSGFDRQDAWLAMPGTYIDAPAERIAEGQSEAEGNNLPRQNYYDAISRLLGDAPTASEWLDMYATRFDAEQRDLRKVREDIAEKVAKSAPVDKDLLMRFVSDSSRRLGMKIPFNARYSTAFEQMFGNQQFSVPELLEFQRSTDVQKFRMLLKGNGTPYTWADVTPYVNELASASAAEIGRVIRDVGLDIVPDSFAGLVMLSDSGALFSSDFGTDPMSGALIYQRMKDKAAQYRESNVVNAATGKIIRDPSNEKWSDGFHRITMRDIEEESSAQKDTIVSRLSKDLPDVAYADADQIVRTWAESSNQTRMAQELQAAAVDEVGASMSPWQAETAKSAGGAITLPETGDVAQVRRKVRKAVRNMYDTTQKDFRDAGVKHVRLYRGVKTLNEARGAKVGDVIQFKDNALASWSTSFDVARGFGNIIVEAVVPVDRILCTARTGFGCLNEREVVVIGTESNSYARLVRSTL